MMSSEGKDSDEFKKSLELQNKMDEYARKIDDFMTLASTLKVDAPHREAFKIVFGQDRPDLDPSTPEGMRAKNLANAKMGKSNG